MDIKEIVKDAVVVSESATFEEALSAMENNKTNTLLVVDSDGALSGEVVMTNVLEAIVPERFNGDEAMEHLSSDEGLRTAIRDAMEKPVSDFMSMDFTALEMGDNMLNVIATAIAHNRSSIPVVDEDNHPIGLISRRGLKQIIRKFADN